MLAACNNTEHSNSAEVNSSVNEPHVESVSNDEAENRGDKEKSEGEYEFTYDITEITNDDRFIPLAGTIEEMIEFNETITDNEHFRANLVRYIFLVDSLTYAYQLEIENKLDRDINIKIINALADGNDTTEITYIDYGKDAYLDEGETVYETLYITALEEEITSLDELKVEFEVTDLSPNNLYDKLGVHEVVFDF